jgi:transposase-like protein
VVADGAPGLMKAVEELWSEADRQRCTTHRLRNITAKLPQQPELQERVKAAYWSALDNATSAADAESRLRRLVGELERTCLRCVFISTTRSGCASGSAPRIFSSARWRR